MINFIMKMTSSFKKMITWENENASLKRISTLDMGLPSLYLKMTRSNMKMTSLFKEMTTWENENADLEEFPY